MNPLCNCGHSKRKHHCPKDNTSRILNYKKGEKVKRKCQLCECEEYEEKNK
jgi:hypothetical protein